MYPYIKTCWSAYMKHFCLITLTGSDAIIISKYNIVLIWKKCVPSPNNHYEYSKNEIKLGSLERHHFVFWVLQFSCYLEVCDRAAIYHILPSLRSTIYLLILHLLRERSFKYWEDKSSKSQSQTKEGWL